MIKLRVGMAAFQIEVGRWQGVERKEKMCKECQSGEVEDVCHWVLQCPPGTKSGDPCMVEEVSQCDGFQGQSLTKQGGFVWPQHALIILFSTISAQCGVPDLVCDS